MGEKGAVLYRGNDSCSYRASAKSEEIIDTIGAGDAYAAILCLGYMRNWNLKKINKVASEFASEVIKIKGALPADDSLYIDFRKRINN